jgi:flagellar hook-associated protein 1 FlgK
MSDLLSLLGVGSAAISAQNAGIGVASENVANVNTPGRSRQRVDLQEVSSYGGIGLGGVRAAGSQRYADDLLAGSIRVAGGALAMSSAFVEALDTAQAAMSSGRTLDEELSALFVGFQRAAQAPTDPVSRNAVISAARALVAGIHRRAEAATEARVAADSRIRDKATQVTALAKQIAAANNAIARTGDPVAKDKRDLAAKQLSELVGGKARIDGDGHMRFVLDGGAVLVDGTHAAQMVASPGTGGMSRLEVVDGQNRRDVTASLTAGSLGGELAARDVALAKTVEQLDQLAYDVATSMNAVHSANAGLDGTSGRDLFTAPTGVAGAAAALALDPTVAADPDLLALGAPGAGAGDNQGAIAMVALSGQAVAAGGTTLGEASLTVVGDLAQSSASASADAQTAQLLTDHLAGVRDSLSGVDTQEELAALQQFEHVSTAMMRFVATVDDLLGTMIETL